MTWGDAWRLGSVVTLAGESAEDLFSADAGGFQVDHVGWPGRVVVGAPLLDALMGPCRVVVSHAQDQFPDGKAQPAAGAGANIDGWYGNGGSNQIFWVTNVNS
jgi:hypothetical protein